MNEYFEESRATPSEASEELLDQFLSIGAVKAIREHVGEKELEAADAGVRRLARAMVRAGTRQPDGSTQVDEDAFVAARQKTCPLYAFC